MLPRKFCEKGGITSPFFLVSVTSGLTEDSQTHTWLPRSGSSGTVCVRASGNAKCTWGRLREGTEHLGVIRNTVLPH